MKKDKINQIVYTALMMALVFVMTFSIRIPVPFTQGYIHGGDSMIFVAVLILGWRNGAIAAGMGSALSDLLAGYSQYILPTLVIKGMMAVLMGLALEKTNNSKKGIFALSGITVGIWLVFNAIIHQIITVKAVDKSETLINALEDVSNSMDLSQLIEKAESQIFVFALIIPVLLIIGSLYIKKKEKISVQIPQLLGMTLAGFWMIFGYFIVEGIMYGNYAIAAFSVPWNMIQFFMGFVIAVLVWAALKKTPIQKYYE